MAAKILVVMGVSGSGKTTVGELLARTLQSPSANGGAHTVSRGLTKSRHHPPKQRVLSIVHAGSVHQLFGLVHSHVRGL